MVDYLIKTLYIYTVLSEYLIIIKQLRGIIMAVNEQLLRNAGYYQTSEGVWQRVTAAGGVGGNDETMTVSAYTGGDIIDTNLTMDLANTAINNFRSRNQSFITSLFNPSVLGDFHENEMQLQVNEAMTDYQKSLNELSKFQNLRLIAEVELAKQDSSSPLRKAELSLHLYNAILNEVKSIIKSKEAERDIYCKQEWLYIGRCEWPTSESSAEEGKILAQQAKEEYERVGKEIDAENETLNNIKNEINKISSEIQSLKKENISGSNEIKSSEKDNDKYIYAKKDLATINAIQFNANFFETLTEKFGSKASSMAKELKKQAKGKKIRSAKEAIATFDKYGRDIFKKFNAKDIEAIRKALLAADLDMMAKNMAKFSKAFGIAGKVVDFKDLTDRVITSFETGDWKPVFIKLETISLGSFASYLVAIAFSFMATARFGILAFATIMAVVSALIDEDLVENINNFIITLKPKGAVKNNRVIKTIFKR